MAMYLKINGKVCLDTWRSMSRPFFRTFSTTEWLKGQRSSRAREFHPHPLTEPCVKVSPHTALHTQLFVHRQIWQSEFIEPPTECEKPCEGRLQQLLRHQRSIFAFLTPISCMFEKKWVALRHKSTYWLSWHRAKQIYQYPDRLRFQACLRWRGGDEGLPHRPAATQVTHQQDYLGFILRFLAMAMTEQAHHCSSGLTKTFLDKELDGLSHVLLTYHN